MTKHTEPLTILITGGSSGYGAGMAEVLASCGHTVWITGRRKEALEAVARKTGASYIVADVSSATDWEKVISTIADRGHDIDVLINNAGAGIAIKPLDEQTVDELEQSIQINLFGAMLGARAVLPGMKQRKSGLIIHVSSVCAVHAWPGFAAYSAAKAGLEMLNRCLHTECREFGIRSTIFRPSWGATDFAASAGLGEHDPEVAQQCMQPRECGDMIRAIIETPPHLSMPLVTTQPLVQDITPM
jgi:gluconate 5-dehydrogenase/3-oxoacyl-[acyl-carrier protein] reductase